MVNALSNHMDISSLKLQQVAAEILEAAPKENCNKWSVRKQAGFVRNTCTNIVWIL